MSFHHEIRKYLIFRDSTNFCDETDFRDRTNFRDRTHFSYEIIKMYIIFTVESCSVYIE